MATLESLHELLDTAVRILDEAAGEIRDVPLEPTKENIRGIGEALGRIFDIERQIYKLRPELIPTHLWDMRGESEPSPELIVEGAFRKAALIESAGDNAKAIELLQFLIRTQPQGSHIERAQQEIARLRQIK